MDTTTTLGDLKTLVHQFKTERGWQHGHSPRNVATSIAIEAAELLEHYQWNDNAENMAEVTVELADIIIYCLSFADATNIDIASAVKAKISHNRKKFPVEKFNPKTKVSAQEYADIRRRYKAKNILPEELTDQ